MVLRASVSHFILYQNKLPPPFCYTWYVVLQFQIFTYPSPSTFDNSCHVAGRGLGKIDVMKTKAEQESFLWELS